jgi:hypothetical protein
MQFRFGYLARVDSETNDFIKCALDVETRLNLNSSKVKWFITGDFERHLKHVRDKYGSKVVPATVISDGVVLHTETGMGFEKTVVDSELLTRCDELIVTGGSTYGFLAAMRSGRFPLYFNGKRGTKACPRMSFTSQGTTPGGAGFV